MTNIDAKVAGISWMADGTARINLVPADRDSSGQQPMLNTIRPPPSLSLLLHRKVWGNGDALMCGPLVIGRMADGSCVLYQDAIERVNDYGFGLSRKRKGRR